MSLILRIHQHDFPIGREYSEGHRLSAGEAAALNQVLLENVRNNVASWVVRAGGSRLDPAVYHDLRERIAAYAANYQFKVRVRSRATNPFEVAIRELAWQRAEAWGSQRGFDADSQEVLAMFVELRTSPAINAQARDLVLQRQTVVSGALEGLEI